MEAEHDHSHSHDFHSHAHAHEHPTTDHGEKRSDALPLWAVKLLAAFLLVAVSVGGCLIPVWIARQARKQAKRGDENPKYLLFKSTLSIINCFAAGAFLGLAFVHLLPEAVEQLSQKDFLLTLPVGGDEHGHAHSYNLAFLLAALGFSAMLALELLLTGGHAHCHDVSVPLSLGRRCSNGIPGFVSLSEGVVGSPSPPSPRSLPHASHHHHAQHHLLCTGASYCPDCDDCVEATTTANGVSAGEKDTSPPPASRSLPSEKDFPVGIVGSSLMSTDTKDRGDDEKERRYDEKKGSIKTEIEVFPPSADNRTVCCVSARRRTDKEDTKIELPVVISDCMQEEPSGVHASHALDELASPYQDSPHPPSPPVTASRSKLSSVFHFPPKGKLSASHQCGNSPSSLVPASSRGVSPSGHALHDLEGKTTMSGGDLPGLPSETGCCRNMSTSRKRPVDDAANENKAHTGSQKDQSKTSGHCSSFSSPCCRGGGGGGRGGERGSSCHRCTDHSHSPDSVSRIHAGATGANVQGGDDPLDKHKTSSSPTTSPPHLEESSWSPVYHDHIGDHEGEDDCHGDCAGSTRLPTDKKNVPRSPYRKISLSHDKLLPSETFVPPTSSSFEQSCEVVQCARPGESSTCEDPSSHVRTGIRAFSVPMDGADGSLGCCGAAREYCLSMHAVGRHEGGTSETLLKGGGGNGDLKSSVTVLSRRGGDEKQSRFGTNFIERISHCDGTKKGSLIIALAIHAIFEGIVLGTTRQTADVWIATLAILGHKGAEAVAVASTLLQLNMRRICYLMMFSIFVLASPLGIFIGSFAAASENTGVAGVFNALAVGAILFAMNEMLSEFTGRCSRRKRLLKIFAFLVGLTLLFGLDLLHAPFCHQHGEAHDHYHHTDSHKAHADHKH